MKYRVPDQEGLETGYGKGHCQACYKKDAVDLGHLSINQSINFYLLKMSRDTHKRLFNCEQDNKAETSTNSCPTNKVYYERKVSHSQKKQTPEPKFSVNPLPKTALAGLQQL